MLPNGKNDLLAESQNFITVSVNSFFLTWINFLVTYIDQEEGEDFPGVWHYLAVPDSFQFCQKSLVIYQKDISYFRYVN